jgi:hypothetical protein
MPQKYTRRVCDLLVINKIKKKYFYIIPYVMFFLGCHFSDGFLSASQSIEESKINGVFISEYRPLTNPLIINDTLSIRIKEVWIEKKWINTNEKNKAFPIVG